MLARSGPKMNVKTEPENLHENQAPWIFGSQGSPVEEKQWFGCNEKTKKQKSTSTKEILKHCTHIPEYFSTSRLVELAV